MTWSIIRGSGLVAYALLAGSVIWGLVLSTGVLGRKPGSKVLTYMHEALAIGALLATGSHMAFLLYDEYVEFTVLDLLLPGLSAWRADAVAFGVVAAWLLLVVTVSFYIRPIIGQRAWRAIHYAGSGTFVAALLHGLMAGTDTGNPAVLVLYGATAGVIVVLLAARLATGGRARSGNRVPATPR